MLGVDPMQVEALAFAWLARQCFASEPGNLPAVTGAAGPRVLGAAYPAWCRPLLVPFSQLLSMRRRVSPPSVKPVTPVI